MNSYIQTGKGRESGTPSVNYFAEEQKLSSNYFGDLVKKETGKSANDHIQDKVIEIAKQKIFDREKTLSEIAHELGFTYPQHFTRLFKKKMGKTPNEYRMLN